MSISSFFSSASQTLANWFRYLTPAKNHLEQKTEQIRTAIRVGDLRTQIEDDREGQLSGKINETGEQAVKGSDRAIERLLFRAYSPDLKERALAEAWIREVHSRHPDLTQMLAARVVAHSDPILNLDTEGNRGLSRTPLPFLAGLALKHCDGETDMEKIPEDLRESDLNPDQKENVAKRAGNVVWNLIEGQDDRARRRVILTREMDILGESAITGYGNKFSIDRLLDSMYSHDPVERELATAWVKKAYAMFPDRTGELAVDKMKERDPNLYDGDDWDSVKENETPHELARIVVDFAKAHKCDEAVLTTAVEILKGPEFEPREFIPRTSRPRADSSVDGVEQPRIFRLN